MKNKSILGLETTASLVAKVNKTMDEKCDIIRPIREGYVRGDYNAHEALKKIIEANIIDKKTAQILVNGWYDDMLHYLKNKV